MTPPRAGAPGKVVGRCGICGRLGRAGRAGAGVDPAVIIAQRLGWHAYRTRTGRTAVYCPDCDPAQAAPELHLTPHPLD